MAIPEAPNYGPMLSGITQELAKTSSATKRSSVAILTAAVVSKMLGPVSIEQVLEIHTDVYFSIYGEPTSAQFKEWAKTKDARVKKVWT